MENDAKLTVDEFNDWADRAGARDWYTLMNEDEMTLALLGNSLKETSGHYTDDKGKLIILIKDGLIWRI